MRARLVLFTLLSLFCLSGCVKSLPPKAPLPDVSIGLVEFNQVFALRELIAGFIPENTQIVEANTLEKLDLLFSKIISEEIIREIKAVPAVKADGTKLAEHKSGRHSAILYWAELGREAGLDILILPQIIYWNIGADKIHLKIDFYLISTLEKGALVDRSSFELEKGKQENIQVYVQKEIEKAMQLALREFRI